MWSSKLQLVSFLLLQFTPSFAYYKNSGEALTGRYWDCCKPSCGWAEKANVFHPVNTCDAKGKTIDDIQAGSGCQQGGTAWACPSQSMWAVNDTFSLGTAGAFLIQGMESDWCCACFQLNFTDDPLKNKSLIVQVTNTDYDVRGDNMFTFGIPGGNATNSNGCSTEYNLDASIFGSNQTGVGNRKECDDLPEIQRKPCQWRYDWLLDIKGPKVTYQRVTCPAELYNLTGCQRKDDSTFLNSAAASESVSLRTLWFMSLMATAFSCLLI